MLLDRGTGRKLVLVALISFDLIADVVIEAQKIFVSQIFDCQNTLHLHYLKTAMKSSIMK